MAAERLVVCLCQCVCVCVYESDLLLHQPSQSARLARDLKALHDEIATGHKRTGHKSTVWLTHLAVELAPLFVLGKHSRRRETSVEWDDVRLTIPPTDAFVNTHRHVLLCDDRRRIGPRGHISSTVVSGAGSWHGRHSRPMVHTPTHSSHSDQQPKR